MKRNTIEANSRLPYNPKLTERAKELRKNMTKEEKKLWYDFLSKLNVRFLRQRPIDNYIVDFYCPKFKLVIEVDGSQHYSGDGLEYDVVRTEILSAYDLKVIRVSNIEINKYFETVCSKINGIINATLASTSRCIKRS